MANSINVSNIASEISGKDIIGALPPEIISKIDLLVTIAKAIGIIFIIYIIFMVIKWVSDILRNRRIKKIYNKVYEIDEKLNKLLEKKRNPGKPYASKKS